MTQEELDKRDSLSSEIGITDDVMRMVGDIEDPIIKLKILKSLLSKVISNQEVIGLIQDTIDDMEASKEKETSSDDSDGDDFGDFDFGGGGSSGGGDDFGDFDFGDEGGDFDFGDEGGDLGDIGNESGGGEDLPSPSDLGAGDFTEL